MICRYHVASVASSINDLDKSCKLSHFFLQDWSELFLIQLYKMVYWYNTNLKSTWLTVS